MSDFGDCSSTFSISTPPTLLNPKMVEPSDDVGIAGKLFKSCLTLYSESLKGVRASNNLTKQERHQLRNQLQRFFLWGDGFQAGKGHLDAILARSNIVKAEAVRSSTISEKLSDNIESVSLVSHSSFSI